MREFRTAKAVPLLYNVNPFSCTRLTYGNNRCKANPASPPFIQYEKATNTEVYFLGKESTIIRKNVRYNKEKLDCPPRRNIDPCHFL